MKRLICILWVSVFVSCVSHKTPTITSNPKDQSDSTLLFAKATFTQKDVVRWTQLKKGDTLLLSNMRGILNMRHEAEGEIILGIAFAGQRNSIWTLSYFTTDHKTEGIVISQETEEAYEVAKDHDYYFFVRKPKNEIFIQD